MNEHKCEYAKDEDNPQGLSGIRTTLSPARNPLHYRLHHHSRGDTLHNCEDVFLFPGGKLSASAYNGTRARESLSSASAVLVTVARNSAPSNSQSMPVRKVASFRSEFTQPRNFVFHPCMTLRPRHSVEGDVPWSQLPLQYERAVEVYLGGHQYYMTSLLRKRKFKSNNEF